MQPYGIPSSDYLQANDMAHWKDNNDELQSGKWFYDEPDIGCEVDWVDKDGVPCILLHK